MKRRPLLAALATAAAGCAGRRGGDTTPAATTSARAANGTVRRTTTTAETTETTDTTDTTEATETADDDPSRFAEADVLELATADRTLALSPPAYRPPGGGEVLLSLAATATAEHPARLRATLTNDADVRRTFRLDRVPPFRTSYLDLRELPDGFTFRDNLHLAPAAAHELAATVPDHELADDGRWRYDGIHFAPDVPETVALDPGESVRGEWLLLGHRKASGWPPGIYEARVVGAGGRERAFSITAWRTSAPGPSERSRFEGATVPPLPDADRMRWYHEADASTRAYLEPSDEYPVLPAALEFTLVNHGRETLAGNPLYWKLHKLHDGEWFHVAPRAWGLPMGFVPPGGTESWRVEAYPGKTVEGGPSSGVGHLGGGRYAFEVGMRADEETHAALVELDAPPQSVEPTRDATVERDGSRVVVTTPRHEGGEHENPATLTISRAETADRTVIPEQVMQPRNLALRNGLAFFESGVETVELRTDDRTAGRLFGPDEERIRVRLDGRAFEARMAVEESG